MNLGPHAKPKRDPLAVVTRDASNPSTGLFAKQQVAGVERFERPSGLLESLILPLDETPIGPGILRVTCAGFYSHDRVGHPRIFELPAPVVGHSGIEPETSDLSGLRANRLCQCPLFRLII